MDLGRMYFSKITFCTTGFSQNEFRQKGLWKNRFEHQLDLGVMDFYRMDLGRITF
jgi:hypothetical protein